MLAQEKHETNKRPLNDLANLLCPPIESARGVPATQAKIESLDVERRLSILLLDRRMAVSNFRDRLQGRECEFAGTVSGRSVRIAAESPHKRSIAE